MELVALLEAEINELLAAAGRPPAGTYDFDTRVALRSLGESLAHWESREREQIAFLSKRLEISGKLFLGYHATGRKATDDQLTEAVWKQLVAALLFRAALLPTENTSPLKALNVLCKALNGLHEDWLAPESPLREALESRLNEHCATPSMEVDAARIIKAKDPIECTSRLLELTVLFYEGPIARAYLETLHSMGLRPKKIIELVPLRDLVTKRPLGRLLPGSLRRNYAASVARSKIHHWPRAIAKQHPDLITAMSDTIAQQFGFDQASQSRARTLVPLSDYSDDVDSLLIDGLSDPLLCEYLTNHVTGDVLFTGGGIVPASLLTIPGVRLLHVHPGYLPDVRGADCVLWSTLVAGRSSATIFCMAEGIDTGDIIEPCWLPSVVFPYPAGNLDKKTLYRAVYAYYDPWVRAAVLRQALRDGGRYYSGDVIPQNEDGGTTYHFMHDQLVERALRALFI